MFEAKVKQLTLAPKEGTALAERWPTIKEGYEIAGPYKLYRAWRRLTLPFRIAWSIMLGGPDFRLICKQGQYTDRMVHAACSSLKRVYGEGRSIYDPRCSQHKWVPVGEVSPHLNPPSKQARCLKCGETTNLEA